MTEKFLREIMIEADTDNLELNDRFLILDGEYVVHHLADTLDEIIEEIEFHGFTKDEFTSNNYEFDKFKVIELKSRGLFAIASSY